MGYGSQSPLPNARREAYRRVVLVAAERVFAEHGFEAAKIQAIADAAGISVGTVYTAFANKSDLFSAVLTWRLPELLELTRARAITAKTPLLGLIEGLRAWVIYMLEHPDYLQIHLREHPWGIGPSRATAEQLAAWTEGLELEAMVLKDAIEQGLVIQEDPHRLARCVIAMQQVQLWDWVENGMKEPPRDVADRMARLFVEMFCVDKEMASK